MGGVRPGGEVGGGEGVAAVGGGVVVGVVSTVVEVEVVNAVVEVVLTVLVVVEVDVRFTPAEASDMPLASKTTVTPTVAAANCRKRARFVTATCPIGRVWPGGHLPSPRLRSVT